jgi:thioredoxin 1
MAAKHLSTADFNEVVKSEPLAMVDFWASWCGPCKMLAPTVDALAEQYEGKALVAKVNIDEEPDLAARYGVMSIPTVIFLKNGQEFERKVGLMPASAYTDVLESNL